MRKAAITGAIPVLLGIVAFYVVVGPRVLNPINIAWLEGGDPATHYLGWLFFRNADWAFPLGLNPNYGLELGNAIVFSDSNPLFAILFKLFSPVLPEPFQYFGIWIFVCFILQAWFSWKLIGLVSDSNAIRLLGAGFFVFSPAMIWRLHWNIGHLSLVGHFLVVAALYLVFRPKSEKRLLAWGCLLVVAALVHAYFLGMVMLLWLADLVGRITKGDQTIHQALSELGVLAPVIGLVCWQAGYFSVGRGAIASGYGRYRMNLLSPIDPGKADYGLWSSIMMNLSGDEGHHEGFNFLGIGVIALLFFTIPVLIRGKVNLVAAVCKKPFLLILLGGFALFALSNKVGIGPYNFEYSLPELMLSGANIFRASGRMFWPCFYALLYVAIFLIVRGNGRRTAIFLMALAIILQVVDTSTAWRKIRHKLMVDAHSEWSTPLKDQFWGHAAVKYRKVRWIQPGNAGDHWKTFAAYAGKYNLASDVAYVSRISESALSDAHGKAAIALHSGQFDPDTLYILDEESLSQAVLNVNSDTDLLTQIDGYNVLAPGWKIELGQ